DLVVSGSHPLLRCWHRDLAGVLLPLILAEEKGSRSHRAVQRGTARANPEPTGSRGLRHSMLLVRMGDVVLNMDHLLTLHDCGTHMVVVFLGSSRPEVLSVTVEGESCQLWRGWLKRTGVNDLLTETPA